MLRIGKTVMSGPEADILPGNALPIRNIPLGTQIHNIELRPGKGGQMARSAGAFAQLVAKEGDHAQLRMTSGEIRRVPAVSMQLSDRSATSSMRTSLTAKRGARVGKAFARTCAAWR